MNPVDEATDLMGEGVLISEGVARRPPGGDLWVGRLGDQDGAESRVLLGGVVDEQLVQPLQVEGDRPGRTVELEPQSP